MGEGPKGRRLIALPTGRWFTSCISDLIPLVLIVVTVKAEQLPVASIGWIVIVIVVFVMDRELTELFTAEFASAPPTDPGIHLERLPPIGLLPLIPVAQCLGKNLVLPIGI